VVPKLAGRHSTPLSASQSSGPAAPRRFPLWRLAIVADREQPVLDGEPNAFLDQGPCNAGNAGAVGALSHQLFEIGDGGDRQGDRNTVGFGFFCGHGKKLAFNRCTEKYLFRLNLDSIKGGCGAPDRRAGALQRAGLPAMAGSAYPDRAMAPNPNVAPVLFDCALLRARQSRASGFGPATFLLDRVAEDMAERLHAVLREFKDAADLGTPGDQVRNALQERVDQLARVDLPDLESEPLPFEAESLDLIVSALAFHFVNDLPGVLAQIRRALRPDGLLLAAMIGGETLTELRQSFAAAEAECEGGVSPRVAPFADLRDVGALLQRAGFALPVTDVDRIVVRYTNAFALMQDLRGMGATNILLKRRRTPTRRATMLRMAQIYGERFADPDGRIRATFDVIWLSGWAPHESQQQPLRPGSAKASLAEAVKKRK
jgi:SAM-dependent methyltransferase